MNFKYALGLLGVLLLAGSSLLGQGMDLSGHWKGTITQNPGGFKTIYDFEVVLKQEGEKITGVSYVLVDTIFARMSLSGALDTEEFFNFEELEIIDFSAFQGMEWCVKKGQLRLKMEKDYWRLEGNWQGRTSFSNCVPGQIYLKKRIPRA